MARADLDRPSALLRTAVHSRAPHLGVLILDLLASGATWQEILDDHPGLVEVDIQACLAYGAEMARERYVDVPLEPAA